MVADSAHPANTWAKKLPMVRKMMVGNHPLIVGLGFLDSGFNFRILSAACPNMDSFDQGCLLGGSLGDSAYAANPVSIDEAKLFGNMLCLVAKDSVVPDHDFLHLGPLQEGGLEDSVPDVEYRAVEVPICFPLLPHHGLLEGPITSRVVGDKIDAYCAVGKTWIEACRFLKICPAASHKVEPFEDNVVPPGVDHAHLRSTVTVHFESIFDPMDGDPTSLFARVSSKVTQLRETNAQKYYKEHPNEQPGSSIASSVHPDAGSVHTGTVNTASKLSSALKLKRIEPFLKLFGATVGSLTEEPERRSVFLPTLSADYLELFNESSATTMSRYFRNSLEHHCLLREDSPLFLEKQTDFPHLSQAAGMLLICYNWKSTPLDENVRALNQELSLYNYFPPPYEGRSEMSKQYEAYVSAAKNVEFEEDLGQTQDKRDRIDTKTFLGGRQKTIYDVLGTIANLDADLSFRFDYAPDNAPMIVNMVRSIGDRISRKDFGRWFYKFSASAPWITHSLITYIHGIITALVFVASTARLQKAVIADSEIDPTVFRPVTQRYEDVMRDLDQAVHNSCLGAFSSAPSSFKKRKADEPPVGDGVPPPAARSGESKGFLLHRSNARIQLPRLSQPLCMAFCQRGFSCGNHFSSCTNGRHAMWSNIGLGDRNLIKEFVANNPAVTLVLPPVRT